MNEQRNYVVELLIENESGGLEDREIILAASSEDEARDEAERRNPSSVIGYVGLDDDQVSA